MALIMLALSMLMVVVYSTVLSRQIAAAGIAFIVAFDLCLYWFLKDPE